MRRFAQYSLRRISSEDVVPKFTQLYINGEWTNSSQGKQFDVINPSKGEVVCQVEQAFEEDVNYAVESARNALSGWKNLAPGERGEYLWRVAEIFEERREEIAAIEALDNGKPYKFANMVDLSSTIRQFKYFAGWADKLEGKTVDIGGDFMNLIFHEPYGVCGHIIPWNYPLLMFSWKIAPSLATGNVCVLKSSSNTPLSALAAASVFDEAGVPPGVINVVSGRGETCGNAIVRHHGIDKVSFTGSTETGRDLMISSGESNVKPVTLELGGKSPFIVFPDFIKNEKSIDKIVNLCAQGCFSNQGQVCSAATRIFVHEDIHDEFVEKASELSENRVVGDSFDESTQQGPQISEKHMNKILGYIEKVKSEGATLSTGGYRITDQGRENGYFVAPTVFSDVTDDMTISREEIFGPVMSVLKFSEEEEVIERANDTIYGLAAGILTNDVEIGFRCMKKLEAGTIWWNCWNVFDANIPFGGFKMSGFGKESSVYAIKNFMKEKVCIVNIPGLKQ